MKRTMFKSVRLTLKEMQEIINDYCYRKEKNIIISSKKYEDVLFGYDEEKETYYIKDKSVKIDNKNIFISVLNQEIALYGKFNNQYLCLWSYLEDDYNKISDYQSSNFKVVKGSDCFRIMQQYNKIPKLNSYHEAPITNVSQLFYKNRAYFYRKIENCICYDINSAFSYIQLNFYCDFKDLGKGIVENGEVGFNLRYDEFNQFDLETTYLPVAVDHIAEHRFKLKNVPEGIYKFVNKYYNVKDLSKNIEFKQKAKNILNFSIGESVNHNWIYRTLIVSECNLRVYKIINMIRELYGDVVLYANTDCVATTCRIGFLDNMLGHKIGEFKIEKTGTLYMNDEAYQWNDSKPVYSGVPSFKFKRFQEEYHKQLDLSKESELIKLKGFLSNETKYTFNVEKLKIEPFSKELNSENNKILFGLKPSKYRIVGGIYGETNE